ncbi:MAG: MogA/MoaB family molybdenum cofactor biosynthesis protein [Haloarculaceae archaeon]
MGHHEGEHSREGNGDAAHDGHHGHHASDVESVGFGILTISSTRARHEDPTGDAMEAAVEDAGKSVADRQVVTDEVDTIRAAVEAMVADDSVDVVVTSGGTGLTRDDVTLQAVDPLFTRQIPGFGELFRLCSYEDIGPRAILSRASAGLADDVPVFCVPGSEAGATLGLEELILPTAAHAVGLAQDERD